MNKLTTIGALLGACALLITIQDASTVAADPTITLSVQLSTPTSVGIDGAAVLAAEQIDLEDGTHLLEPDGSHAAVANSGVGPVNLGAYAHSGGITSTGPVVFIRDGAHVHGDVVTAQAFAHQNVWHVDGNVHEDATVALQSEQYLQVTFSSAATPGVHLEPGVVLGTPIDPGHYTELILKPNAQATLVAGDYLFGTFAVEPGGQITVDDSAGPAPC